MGPMCTIQSRSCSTVRKLLLMALLAAVAACAPTEYQNTALRTGRDNPERRTIVPDDPRRPVILMTFSGGGSRAAALAASVLRAMRETTYTLNGQRHALTDDVRLVSSVSGGSVTAAWFGLHGADGLDDLRSRFLTRDNMAGLELEAVNPITWFRLAFTKFTRIRALEALFDERLFDHAPMAALNQSGRPVIIPNTTDIGGGQSFGITPQRFDDICSDFDALPISVAVAASAAFPIALSPVDFQNNAAGCQGTLRSDDWATLATRNPFTPYLNLPTYRDARYVNDLRRGANPFRDIRYLHFLDGGLADNLGVKTLRSALISPYDEAGGLNAINQGRIRNLVVILVNARSDPPNQVYQEAGTPGLVQSINAVTSVPLDSNTANSASALQDLLTEVGKAAQGAKMKAGFAGMKVYGVTVDYDQLPTDTPEHIALRDEAKDVPTSWTLTSEQLAVTEKVGQFLLDRHPCFGRLLRDLGATPRAGALPAVDVPCVTAASY
jgi:NTE family protein